MKMICRIRILLIAAVLLACFAGSATAEALPVQDESDYGLVQSEGIDIPVFTGENMKAFDIPDTEGLRFVRALKAGWNLGNTFDANDSGAGVPGRDYETYWSGAKTSRELVHALKEAGFNLIRMPVSWHNHLAGENYTIDPAWLARVREVADWILDEDMYVIVNIHHDNSEKYIYPDSAHYEQSEKYITAIWSQVAEAFADCGDHVIFESMNEPRLVGTDYEWYLNRTAPLCLDAVDCINRLNGAFVDTVRAAGGENATRWLLVPGYCASPDGSLFEGFQLPEDDVNRIIVEVHAYTPYDFALNTSSPDSSFDLDRDGMKKQTIAVFMSSLYNRYVSQGIPVLIDEFGALLKSADDLQARVNFTAYYVASASTRGMTCVWWDNSAFAGPGEKFGLIDRKTVVWKYPDITLAILRNCLFNRAE